MCISRNPHEILNAFLYLLAHRICIYTKLLTFATNTFLNIRLMLPPPLPHSPPPPLIPTDIKTSLLCSFKEKPRTSNHHDGI